MYPEDHLISVLVENRLVFNAAVLCSFYGNTLCKVTPGCFIWKNVTCGSVGTFRQTEVSAAAGWIEVQPRGSWKWTDSVFFFIVKMCFYSGLRGTSPESEMSLTKTHYNNVGEFAQRRSPSPPGQKVTVERKKRTKQKHRWEQEEDTQQTIY